MKNFQTLLSWLSLSSLLLTSHLYGHARFKLNAAFQARNNSSGLKAEPCGGIARTDKVTILRAGQTVEIEWEETIDHPGYYIISFSPSGDQGFQDDGNVLIANHPDDQNDRSTVPHSFNATIEVPNVICDDCTLQLIQVMTDRNPPVNYYSCTDIEIRAADDPTVTPPPSPEGLRLEIKGSQN